MISKSFLLIPKLFCLCIRVLYFAHSTSFLNSNFDINKNSFDFITTKKKGKRIYFGRFKRRHLSGSQPGRVLVNLTFTSFCVFYSVFFFEFLLDYHYIFWINHLSGSMRGVWKINNYDQKQKKKILKTREYHAAVFFYFPKVSPYI